MANVKLSEISAGTYAPGTDSLVGVRSGTTDKLLSGVMAGVASATDNAIVRFDTTSGKIVQNSVVRLDDNGCFLDNGLNGTVGKSVDSILHVLWSADFGIDSVPVFDFTGNGGGGVITTGARLVYDRGEDNFAFFVPLADHNYNVSLNTDTRIATGVGGDSPLSWANAGPDLGVNISFGYNGGAGGNETYISNGYLNLNYTTGVGSSAQCLGTGGGGEVMAISAPALDGTNFYNIPPPSGLSTVAYSGSYQDLSNAPVSGGYPYSANMTTDLDMSAHVLFDNGGFLRVGTTMFSNSGTSDLGIAGQPWVNLYVNNLIDPSGNTILNVAAGQQSSSGAQTAGVVYTATEQTMLQQIYNAGRALGLMN